MPETADQTLERLLEPGETVIWRGRPDTGLRVMKREWFLYLLAPGLTFFGVYAMIVGAERGDMPGWASVFFGALIPLGLGLLPLTLWAGRERRRRTRYALTDRRALAVSTFRRGFVRRWPMEKWTDLYVTSETGGLGSVVIHTYSIGRQLIEEGFDLIPDAWEVERLMRERLAARSAELRMDVRSTGGTSNPDS